LRAEYSQWCLKGARPLETIGGHHIFPALYYTVLHSIDWHEKRKIIVYRFLYCGARGQKVNLFDWLVFEK